LSYESFLFVFSFLYIAVFVLLLLHLRWQGKLHFHFKISRVTKKFWKKMVAMQALVYSGTLVTSIAATIDIFILAKFQGLATAAVFSLAQYAANLVQVPQRSIQTVSAGILSQAWKDKNLAEISRIYSRSCINLLLMALFVFGNLWLNVADGLVLTGIQAEYASGLSTILVLGVVRIIDAGTGLNAMVINTSVYWRFDFLSGVALLLLRLPLTYFLIKEYGMLGSAFAELFAYGCYNLIRFEFLRRKFGFQPFTVKTLYAILGAGLCFGLAVSVGSLLQGWWAIALRSTLFSAAFVGFVLWGKITPDAAQLKAAVQKRLGY
jgi:O-antigen/teichoic acid export membrane protein